MSTAIISAHAFLQSRPKKKFTAAQLITLLSLERSPRYFDADLKRMAEANKICRTSDRPARYWWDTGCVAAPKV